MARTSNEEFFDALIRHQIFLLRTSGALRNDVIAVLNATESDIAMRIRERLRNAVGYSPAVQKRIGRLISEIRDIRSAAWQDAESLWFSNFRDLVKNEVNFLATATAVSVPVVVDLNLPPSRLLESLVRTRPFEGKVLREWAKKIAEDDIARISDQIKIGIIQGEGANVIARRVIGSAAFRGTDGVTQITRRQAEAITRTATISFTNAAREEFFAENTDVFTEEVFVATLDSRTTPICRSLDGKRFAVREGPQPPLHWNCRSLRVAAITDELIGDRPANPVSQRQILREFAAEEGLGKLTSRDDIPYGLKGKFDKFNRRRLRESIGQVPAKTTYQEWLKTQSQAFQDDVLGKVRAKLFRQGNLTLDKFVNRAGDEIPLRDLARREMSAFRAAGLNPRDYY
jgi:SPP1 gp7 family putative phage head morphogenesis protein